MIIATWEEFCGKALFPSAPMAMTLGVFDGVHRGHRILMEELEGEGLFSAVFTFRRNPAELTGHKTFKGNILTMDQKLERLEKLGVNSTIIIDFSHDFSKLTGVEFFARITDRVDLRKVVLGENHRLGNKGRMGAREAKHYLEKDGVEVKIIPSLREDEQVISSTLIRELLHRGEFRRAAGLLGYDYSLDLGTAKPEQDKDGFRLKREACRQILPAEGTYPVLLEENQEFFATKLILDDTYMRWNQNSDFPVKNIIFS